MASKTPSIALMTAASLLSGCALFAPPFKGKGVVVGNGIRIGVVSSFSGTSAENGLSTQDGAQIAVDLVNAAGGVLGRKLVLDGRDDQSTTDVAVAQAKALYASGVQMVIGTNASASARRVLLEAAKPARGILISGSATSPALTDKTQVDGEGWFFRTCPNDALQGIVMAQMCKEAGDKTISIIHANGAYGEGFAKRLEAAFKEGGGNATSIMYQTTPEPKADYNDIINAALAPNPDGIVMIAYPGEASVMINDWERSGKFKNVRWYFGDALQAQSFVDNVTNKTVMENRKGTAPFTEPAFISMYEAKKGEKPQFDASGAYDAVMLMALAIEAGKSETAASIRDNLRAVSSGGKRFGPDQIAEALAAVRTGEDVDYDGYSGTVNLDENGDVTSGAYEIWTVKGGKIVASGEVRRP